VKNHDTYTYQLLFLISNFSVMAWTQMHTRSTLHRCFAEVQINYIKHENLRYT